MEVFTFNKHSKDKIVIRSIGVHPGPVNQLAKYGAVFSQQDHGWIIDRHREREFQKILSEK